MVVQDDGREHELIDLFDLEPGVGGRAGTDAYLVHNEIRFSFELKSTTKNSVTTVRDFGEHYLEKWENRHWLIGFYDGAGKELKHAIYGTPEMMSDWILEKALYIEPDIKLAKFAVDGIDTSAVEALFGVKSKYSLSDAKRLQKKQLSVMEYESEMDLEDGYSIDRMVELVRRRVRYLMHRGGTLNNPHIPGSYFNNWPRIKNDHAAALRRFVDSYLVRGSYF